MAVYFLKSMLFMVVFYLLYSLFLSRESFHRFNRWTIWFLLMLSLLLPIVPLSNVPPSWTFTEHNISETVGQLTKVEIDPVPVRHIDQGSMRVVIAKDNDRGVPYAEVAALQSPPLRRWIYLSPWLLGIYLFGVAFFALREIMAVQEIRHLLRQGEQRKADGINFTISDTCQNAFSWYNHILIPRFDLSEHHDEIVAHEMAHCRHHHSIDITGINLIAIFQWFNPAIWLFKRELQMIHEFEADACVMMQSKHPGSGIDGRRYQYLLVERAVESSIFALASMLGERSIKRRILMINNHPSSNRRKWRLLGVLPLTLLLLLACAESTNSSRAERPEIQLSGLWKRTFVSQSGDSVFIIKTLTPDGYFYNAITMPDGVAHIQQSGRWEQVNDSIYLEHMRLNRTGGPDSADVSMAYHINSEQRSLSVRFTMKGAGRPKPYQEVWQRME